MEESKVDMTGRVCLVTGGNSGIGKATALGLAKMNASVVIVSRDNYKGEAALIEVRAKSGNRNLDAMTADLSSQASVRKLARDFTGRYKKLHVLVNNAGIFLPRRVQTVDGLEATFATNHLGHFLLTNLLLDVLKASAPSRIINLTSSPTMEPRWTSRIFRARRSTADTTPTASQNWPTFSSRINWQNSWRAQGSR